MKFEEFWDRHIAGNEPMDHEAALSIFSQPLPEEVTKEYDIADTMLSLLDSYTTQKAFEDLYELVEVLKKHNPTVHARIFHYFHEDLITYFCFRGEEEKVAYLAEAFIENPLKDYDLMLMAIRKANYYGYSSLAGRWVSAIYDDVNNSPDLLPGAAFDLAVIKSYIELENTYNHYRKEQAFNWPQYLELMTRFGFEFDDSYFELMETALTDSLEAVNDSLSGTRQQNLEYLQKVFMRYMLAKGVPFASSGGIWDLFYEYWESSNTDASPSEYFHLEPKDFYKFAENKSGFILDYRFNAAAILWGGIHVYDFLHAVQLLPGEDYEQFIAMIQRMQKLFMKENYDGLWEYSFVHKWGIPDSKSELEVAEEQEAFARSFEWIRGSSPFPKPEDDPEWQKLQEEFQEERKSWLDGRLPGSVEPTQPIRAEKKIGRNEKVTVKYTDGTVKKGIKYKKVQQDVDLGKCEIIG